MNTSFIEPMQLKSMDMGTKAVSGGGQSISGQGGEALFKGVFQDAINNVKETENDLVNKQYLLATGQIDDAHSVMVASSEAQLAVDMLVSLRNKAMDSYNELMRISL